MLLGRVILKVKQAIVNQAKAIRARIEWFCCSGNHNGENIIEGDGIERYELDWKYKTTKYHHSVWRY